MISKKIKQFVFERAGFMCEYCLALLAYSPQPFNGEHIIPESKGGDDDVENLACAAARQDWTGLDNLMTKSTSYVEENEAELRAKGGMPADFKATYAQTVADTRALRTAYIDKKQGVGENNLTKKSANDALYKKATNLCRDAKKYFVADATIAVKFVWDNVLNTLGSTMGSTATQRRKTIKSKQKEKTLFDATVLGMTLKDYTKMQAEKKKADKKAKKKKGRGKKAEVLASIEVPLLNMPALLPAAST
jgi:HNH endonuclease